MNDMPNCSKQLSFRIFADDTDVLYSSHSIHDVESITATYFDYYAHYYNILPVGVYSFIKEMETT